MVLDGGSEMDCARTVSLSETDRRLEMDGRDEDATNDVWFDPMRAERLARIAVAPRVVREDRTVLRATTAVAGAVAMDAIISRTRLVTRTEGGASCSEVPDDELAAALDQSAGGITTFPDRPRSAKQRHAAEHEEGFGGFRQNARHRHA